MVDLPAPRNLSTWWNYGSLLGLCLTAQLITGLFLAIHYSPNVSLAFYSITHIIQDVNYGWLLRNLHANGGSLFFVCIYLHMARGLYYSSFLFIETWNLGVVIFIATMATAFVGYVLPWGQIRFWGATVITNLLSAIPYAGKALVQWVWGGFAVRDATLNRFFAFHFLLPFVLVALSALHLLFLHQTGSNNPLGINSDSDKIPFHPYYTVKDVIGFIILIILLVWLSTFSPTLLTDPENFLPANPLVTPVHIMPEWYFLWAYAILRAIPNKLGGVIAIFAGILILFIPPLTFRQKARRNTFYPLNQMFFWFFCASSALLTWAGGRPVEYPYEILGQLFTCLYFSFFLFNPLLALLWDKTII